MVNTITVSPQEAIDTITALWGLKRSLMLWGRPGAGKSALVGTATRLLKARLIDCRLSQMISSDLIGLPFADHETGVTRFLRPEFLPTDEGPGAIFLDELAGSDEQTRVAAYQLILDRQIGTYHVPDGWMIIAASNRPEDGAISADFGSALNDRLIHLQIETDTDAWLTWAMQNSIHPAVCAYIKIRPDRLAADTDALNGENIILPSPRSWEAVSDVLRHLEGNREANPSAKSIAVCGLVGKEAGMEFIALADQVLKLPDPKRLFAETKTDAVLKLLPQTYDAITAMCYAIAGAVSEKTASDAFRVVNLIKEHEIREKDDINSRIIPGSEIAVLGGTLVCNRALDLGLEMDQDPHFIAYDDGFRAHRGMTALNIADRALNANDLSRDVRGIIDTLGTLGALALAVELVDSRADDSFVAKTDGHNVHFGKSFFERSHEERAFIILHELFHVALGHPLRGKQLAMADPTYNQRLFNIACDGLINNALSCLPRLRRPDKVVTLETIEKRLGEPVGNWSAEQIYWRLKSVQDPTAFADLYAQAGDLESPEKQTRSEADDARTIVDWNNRLDLALGSHPKLAARVRGDIPSPATVPWRTVLRSFVGRSLNGGRTVIDHTRPHRRWSALEPCFRAAGTPLPFLTARRPGPRPRVAVAVDTSGSIDETILTAFTGEIAGMLDKANAEVYLIVCDAAVHQHLELHGRADLHQLRTLRYSGGGGTNFVPAIEAAIAWKPKAMIYLTDLCGPAGQPPPFPMLWSVPQACGPVDVPYGTLVRVAA